MRFGSAVALLAAVLAAAGCQTSGPAPLVEQRDEATGFVVRVPADWTAARTGDGRATR